MTSPSTLFEKIWDDHVVVEEPDSPAVLYIDLHLVHEVTSPQAFTGLRARGLKVRRPDRTVATIDHSIPTTRLTAINSRASTLPTRWAASRSSSSRRTAAEFGIHLYGMGSPHQGIVHVIGPELGPDPARA